MKNSVGCTPQLSIQRMGGWDVFPPADISHWLKVASAFGRGLINSTPPSEFPGVRENPQAEKQRNSRLLKWRGCGGCGGWPSHGNDLHSL